MRHKSGHGSGVRCIKCGVNRCPKGYVVCLGCQMVIRRALAKREGEEPQAERDPQWDESAAVDDDADDDEGTVERTVKRWTD
jgi:hypothetical protein